MQAYAEGRLEPAGTKGAAVALAKLFAIFPLPHADGSRERDLALEVWHDTLAPYPADVLERAVMATIRGRKYSSPPTPGDVVERAEGDERLRNRRELLSKAKRAQFAHRMQERSEAMWRATKASEGADLQRLRDRVAGRQEGVQGGLKRIEPEMTEAEAERLLVETKRAALDALAAEGIE